MCTCANFYVKAVAFCILAAAYCLLAAAFFIISSPSQAGFNKSWISRAKNAKNTKTRLLPNNGSHK